MKSWLSTTLPIAAIFSFRMLGLFMLIPVFTVYATGLTDATPTLLGIALGGYGLSQGLLQIPFGLLSDRYGRKPMLTIGLILFILGSLLGAYTTSIYGMIFARILQGSGAIGSVLIALLADLTPDKERTKAMAVIGSSIGLSFSVAIVISPTITHHYGLAAIFYLTACLGFLGLSMLYLFIPTPTHEPFVANDTINTSRFKQVITNRHLQRLNAGIFFQHLILTATFFAVPLLLQQHMQQGEINSQWHFYLPLMIASFLAMIPCIVVAERKRKTRLIFWFSVLVTLVAQGLLALNYHSFSMLCGLMFAYFVAFNVLEASLPSLVSRQANVDNKGTAMGIYSSSQFLGIFAGGSIAGLLFVKFGYQGIFIANASCALIWLWISVYMQPLAYQFTFNFNYLNHLIDITSLTFRLGALPGVVHVSIDADTRTVYLRVEKSLYEEGSAERLVLSSD